MRATRGSRFEVAIVAAVVSLAGGGGGARADGFWDTFGDGRAEVSGYALTQPRYGAPRAGTAVLIFVTEDFSDSLRVKADPGRHPASDVYPVLKLNALRDFQTGIYGYRVMTSTFARVRPAFPLVKISFSSQEWCGHVYEQLLARDGRLEGVQHSYFDGEADAPIALPIPDGAVFEDAAPIRVRGLKGDALAPGESREVPFLPSSLRARLEHRPRAFTRATLRRSSASEAVTTAIGRRSAHRVSLTEPDGRATTWLVEDEFPHRILGWESTTGESAAILGSARLAYWEMNGPGGEAALRQVGLAAPRPGRVPPAASRPSRR